MSMFFLWANGMMGSEETELTVAPRKNLNDGGYPGGSGGFSNAGIRCHPIGGRSLMGISVILSNCAGPETPTGRYRSPVLTSISWTICRIPDRVRSTRWPGTGDPMTCTNPKSGSEKTSSTFEASSFRKR